MGIDLDEVWRWFKRHKAEYGHVATRKLLEKHGARTVSDLSPKSYAAFVADANAATTHARAWAKWKRQT